MIDLARGPEDFMLFHWAPAERRKSILKRGLRIGRMSTDRVWKAPYVAFAHTPQLAWRLSANREVLKGEYPLWDLWGWWAKGGFEMIPFDDGDPREYRIYHDISIKKLWFIGSRTDLGEKEPIYHVG